MGEKVVDLGTTLYEVNKQMVLQSEKPLPQPAIAAAQKKLEDWFNMSIDCYAMLLCWEKRDFTIFHLYENQNSNPPAVAADECIGCLTDRGKILAIDPTSDDAWEIWLRINGEAFCYYLFCYDQAVIEC